MNLKQIKEELAQLSQIITEWEDGLPINSLERDVALEKLRHLYEAIRWEKHPLETPLEIERNDVEQSDVIPPVDFQEEEHDEVEDLEQRNEDTDCKEGEEASNDCPLETAINEIDSDVCEEGNIDEDVPKVKDEVEEDISLSINEESSLKEDDSLALDMGEMLALDDDLEGVAIEEVNEPQTLSEENSSANTIEAVEAVSLEEEEEEEKSLLDSNHESIEKIDLSENIEIENSEDVESEENLSLEEVALEDEKPLLEADSEADSEEPATLRQEEQAEVQHSEPTLFGIEDKTLQHRHKRQVIMSLYDDEEEKATDEEEDGLQEIELRTVENVVETNDPSVLVKTVKIDSSQRMDIDEKDDIFELKDISSGHLEEISLKEEQTHEKAVPFSVENLYEDEEEINLTEEEPISSQDVASEEDEEDLLEEPSSSTEALAEKVVKTDAPKVLGEVMNQHIQTLGDQIQPQHDIATELSQTKLSDLEEAIGVNDKFLLIRDLFHGDPSAYEREMKIINSFEDEDECAIYISDHFSWNTNIEGVKLLTSLLERKFASK